MFKNFHILGFLLSSHAIYMPDVSEEDLQSALNLLSSGVTDPIYDITKFNRRMGAIWEIFEMLTISRSGRFEITETLISEAVMVENPQNSQNSKRKKIRGEERKRKEKKLTTEQGAVVVQKSVIIEEAVTVQEDNEEIVKVGSKEAEETEEMSKASSDKKERPANKEKHAGKKAGDVKKAEDKKKTPANKEKHPSKKAEAVTGDVVWVNSVSYGWWPGCKLSQNGHYYTVKLLALDLEKPVNACDEDLKAFGVDKKDEIKMTKGKSRELKTILKQALATAVNMLKK